MLFPTLQGFLMHVGGFVAKLSYYAALFRINSCQIIMSSSASHSLAPHFVESGACALYVPCSY